MKISLYIMHVRTFYGETLTMFNMGMIDEIVRNYKNNPNYIQINYVSFLKFKLIQLPVQQHKLINSVGFLLHINQPLTLLLRLFFLITQQTQDPLFLQPEQAASTVSLLLIP